MDFAGSQSIVTDKSRFVPSFFMLKSYHRVVRKWKVKCLRRGEFDIDRITIVATDPLGRSTYSLPVVSHSPLTVLPRPLDPDEYLLQPSGLTGEVIVPRKLVSDPFLVSGVREYTQYDSANRIHWSATAREGRIMVRNNDYTSDQNVTLILNMQTRADEGRKLVDEEDIEHGILVAATYLDAAVPLGIPVRLLANGGMPNDQALSTGNGSGREHTLDLLRVLARLEVHKSENLLTYLDTVVSDILATDIVIITAYVEEGMFAFARQRALKGVHVRFLLTRPQDAESLPDDCDFVQFTIHDRNYKEQIYAQHETDHSLHKEV